jgi:tRNA pseudouridine55 synthase
MYSLSELELLAEQEVSALDQILLPTDRALLGWPAVNIADEQMTDMKNGHALQVSNLPANGMVRIYDSNQRFYGIGEVREDGKMAPKPLN